MSELQPLFNLFSEANREPPDLAQTVHVVAVGHTVASQKSMPGVRLNVHADKDGIVVEMDIGQGVRLVEPVHLCFGLYQQVGMQNVRLSLSLQPGAEATLWSHCLFSAAISARHSMQGQIHLMEGASLRYQEAHYHGHSGDIEVVPHARVVLDKGAHYLADFSLIQGRVGRLDIDYEVQVGEAALAELTSRIYGFGSDFIRLRERLDLNGLNARGLVKTRVAIRDQATAEVLGIIEGNAAGARGHVDCMEIVQDEAIASAIPEVRVRNPLAKVTHEAAIGSVDSQQLQTLMSRGLAPNEAIDLIVRGMLA